MGPPSSGTRLMTRLFIAAGCAGDGDTKDYQRWDDEEPQAADPIVIRRHLPVSPKPPSWSGANVIRSLQQRGYTVFVVIMTRDWHATTASHMAQGYTDDLAFSYHWTRTLWRQMFEQLPGDVDFEVVPYEALQRPEYVSGLMARLGLDATAVYEPIEDGNAKYYAAPKKARGKR